MEAELTAAELLRDELGMWPPNDPDREPRHALREVEPQPGDLAAYWFGAPEPRTEQPAELDEGPSLVRGYVADVVPGDHQRVTQPRSART